MESRMYVLTEIAETIALFTVDIELAKVVVWEETVINYFNVLQEQNSVIIHKEKPFPEKNEGKVD